MHVLLAGINHQLAAEISSGLRRSGANVDIAPQSAMALALTDATEYDVIVVDQDLELQDGEALYRQLCARPSKSALLALLASGAREQLSQKQERMRADDLLESYSASKRCWRGFGP